MTDGRPTSGPIVTGLAMAASAISLLRDGWWPDMWGDDPCRHVAECIVGEPLFDTGGWAFTREEYAALLPDELRQGVLDALPTASPRHGENLGNLILVCEEWRRRVTADVGVA